MYERTNRAVAELKRAMALDGVDSTQGLPESLFLFSSTLSPIVNVDLFVTNDERQLLFAWRDDVHHGKGWHIPGGCVRLRESLQTRVAKTPEKELGVPVDFVSDPMVVREAIEPLHRVELGNPLERCHGISFLFTCVVKPGYVVLPECIGWR